MELLKSGRVKIKKALINSIFVFLFFVFVPVKELTHLILDNLVIQGS